MDNQQKIDSTNNIFHGMTSSSSFSGKVIILFIIAIILGVGTGYIFVKHQSGTGVKSSSTSSSLVMGATYGSNDSAFKDMAEGVVQKGGIGNEGQFHLVRQGGADQYVYMTSSLVDLSQFVGHKVKVWGQTQKAKVAGWLMDVGRVEVEE